MGNPTGYVSGKSKKLARELVKSVAEDLKKQGYKVKLKHLLDWGENVAEDIAEDLIHNNIGGSID
jgi:hypothetical protein